MCKWLWLWLLWIVYKTNNSVATDTKTTEKLYYVNEANQQCSDEFWCLDVEKKIDTLFGNLFFTKQQIEEMNNQWIKSHQKFKSITLRNEKHVPAHDTDYDQCCPTKVAFVRNTTLTNIEGQKKILIHLTSRNPPKYQLVPQGLCSNGPGSCSVKCHQEKQTFFLLVADFSNMLAPFTFDRFELPAYCSCKNI